MKNKLLILAIGGLALSGCVSQEHVDRVMASQREPSAAIKQAIVKGARVYLTDPYSVRDAEISSVTDATPNGKIQLVCVRANTKNAAGGYTGSSTISVRLIGAHPISARPNTSVCGMPLQWYPFPELENPESV